MNHDSILLLDLLEYFTITYLNQVFLIALRFGYHVHFKIFHLECSLSYTSKFMKELLEDFDFCFIALIIVDSFHKNLSLKCRIKEFSKSTIALAYGFSTVMHVGNISHSFDLTEEMILIRSRLCFLLPFQTTNQWQNQST